MNERQSQLDFDGKGADLTPLLRYVIILAKRYPKPLSQKDLAKYARVSEAAVSKVCERLYEVCDKKWLARRRRQMLLSASSRAAGQVFWTFFLSGKLKALITSPYGNALIEKLVQGIYRNGLKALPWMGEFFTPDDVLFFSELVATAVADSVAQFERPKLGNLDPAKAQSVFFGYVITIMNSLGPNLQRRIKDETTLRRTLEIRDRARFFLLRALDVKLETVFKDFLEQVPDYQTRTAYLSMYRHTIAFYLDRAISDYITQPIIGVAEKRGIPFDPSYLEIGRFFQPLQTSRVRSRDESHNQTKDGKTPIAKVPP